MEPSKGMMVVALRTCISMFGQGYSMLYQCCIVVRTKSTVLLCVKFIVVCLQVPRSTVTVELRLGAH